ncbi:MAG: Na-translocating system protein MpsC family protein [Veillonellales bacterium]
MIGLIYKEYDMVCIAQLRQDIMKINNAINTKMYGRGLIRQKVCFLEEENIILIIANNQRVPALAALDSKDRTATRLFDMTLLKEFSERLKEELSITLGLSIKCILKDYDPVCELAVTTIVLEKRIIDKK